MELTILLPIMELFITYMKRLCCLRLIGKSLKKLPIELIVWTLHYLITSFASYLGENNLGLKNLLVISCSFFLTTIILYPNKIRDTLLVLFYIEVLRIIAQITAAALVHCIRLNMQTITQAQDNLFLWEILSRLIWTGEIFLLLGLWVLNSKHHITASNWLKILLLPATSILFTIIYSNFPHQKLLRNLEK